MAYVQAELDLAWAESKLEGEYERPVYEVTLLPQTDHFSALAVCLGSEGFESIEINMSSNRISLVRLDGVEVSDQAPAESRFALYKCTAQFAPDPREFGSVRTPEQIRYLYGYYRDWLIPCIGFSGYPPQDIPEFEDFRITRGEWDPYANSPGINSLTEAEVLELRRVQVKCGTADVFGPAS